MQQPGGEGKAIKQQGQKTGFFAPLRDDSILVARHIAVEELNLSRLL